MNRTEAEDYWLGAYAINLVVAEGIAVATALCVLAVFWPSTTPAIVVGVAMTILCPIAFLPFSRTLWLAIDLKLRPESR